MAKACLLLRPGLPYRREAFAAGLSHLGFDVTDRASPNFGAGDLLVIWNRKGQEHQLACRYEARGGCVIVAENGYIGSAPDGGKLYALALSHHNGAGSWPVGGSERLERQISTGWGALDFELKPWRADGEHVLVLPQRGIGAPGVAQPYSWTAEITESLRRLTRRPVRIRPHPGPDKSEPYGDLKGAWCAVTWGSGAAIKAICAGIPVFHCLPTWIGAGAARPRPGPGDIEHPFLGDRLPMLQRLAWAQWSLAEIQSGEAFAWLLSTASP